MRIQMMRLLNWPRKICKRADALAFLQLVRAVGREALSLLPVAESPVAAEPSCASTSSARLAVPGFAFGLFGDGGRRGHGVAPPLASSALDGTVLSSVAPSMRHTE